jgi:hypothetical protein
MTKSRNWNLSFAALACVGACTTIDPSSTENALSSSATYYVATTGSDSSPGSQAQPFRTLQRAVNAAVAGDTIIVADGTYGPEGADNQAMPVNISSQGSATAPITLRAQHRWGAILDCQLQCHSYVNFTASAAYWILDGFDIRNGYAAGVWSNSNGGSHITVSHNHIHHIGNRSDSTQYGIVGFYTDGGAKAYVVDGNVFNDIGRTNTYTNSFDHAIYTHGDLTIVNNVFYHSLNGWEVQTAVGFTGVIANNTFVGPNMYQGGTKPGQIELWDPSGSIVIRGNIFYGAHTTAIDSYTWSLSSGATCQVDNNIVYGSGVTLGAPSACTTSANRLATDPLFVDATNFDFHLQPTSPAIDSGVAVTAAPTDADSVARPQGARADVGAYEWHSSSTTPPPAGSCLASAVGVWNQATQISTETGRFRIELDLTPSASGMNGLWGLSSTPAATYTDMAAIVGFMPSGQIQVRNGGAYQADVAMSYSGGLAYHVRLELDVAHRVYSVWVTPPGGCEVALAKNYAFRGEQAAVTSLSDWNVHSDVGSVNACNVAIWIPST